MMNVFKYCVIFLVYTMAVWAQEFEMPTQQIFFQEDTFDEFAYPYGELDSVYTDQLVSDIRQEWPNARLVKAVSYITRNDIRQVVSYYSALSGLRFEKIGDMFIYIFSEIDGQVASRIEIQTIPIVKIHPVFWPVRINLYHISNPITVDVANRTVPTEKEFKARLGRLFYSSKTNPPVYRKDLSLLRQEELGAQAKVFILDTKDSMYKVYRFFRRNYRGNISKNLGRDGNLSTEYFEIDATFAAGLDRDDHQLIIQVDENPIVFDYEGNSQLLRGHVLIRYIFWTF